MLQAQHVAMLWDDDLLNEPITTHTSTTRDAEDDPTIFERVRIHEVYVSRPEVSSLDARQTDVGTHGDFPLAKITELLHGDDESSDPVVALEENTHINQWMLDMLRTSPLEKVTLKEVLIGTAAYVSLDWVNMKTYEVLISARYCAVIATFLTNVHGIAQKS